MTVHRLIYRRPLLTAMVVALFLHAATILAFPPFFQSTDDTHNLLRVSGIGFGEPVEQLRATSFVIGAVLEAAYSAAPGLPWYGFYFLTVLWLASSAVLYALLSLRPRRSSVLWTFVLWFFLFGLPHVAQLEYTSVAGYVGIGGVLLLLAGGRARLAASAALLFLSCLVRPEGLILVLILTSPVLFFNLLGRLREGRRMECVASIAAILVSVAASWLTPLYSGRSEYWEPYQNRILMARRIHDYNDSAYEPRTKPIYDAVGWTKLDWEMARRFFFADALEHPDSDYEHILSSVPASRKLELVKPAAARVLRHLTREAFLLVLLFTLLLGLGFGRASWGQMALVLSVLGALFLYLAIFKKSPHLRVRLPAYAAVAAAAMFLRLREVGRGVAPVRLRFGLGLALLVAIGVLGARELLLLHGKSRLRVAAAADFREDIARLAPAPDDLYLIWRKFPYQHIGPLDVPTFIGDMRMLPLTVSFLSPVTERRLDEFGVTNVCRAMFEREDVFVITHESTTGLLSGYIEQHYGARVDFVPSFRGRTFTVYRGLLRPR